MSLSDGSISPKDMTLFALGLALRGDTSPEQALDVACAVTQSLAQGMVPDSPDVREALGLWGVGYNPKPQRVAGLICSTPYLEVTLPQAWAVKSKGNGHYCLADESGWARLRWHVHTHDPISITIEDRRWSRIKNVDVRTAVAQVLDRDTVIHVIPVEYPFDRTLEPSAYPGADPYYRRPEDRDQAIACSNVERAGREQTQQWLLALAAGRPLYGVKSWTW